MRTYKSPSPPRHEPVTNFRVTFEEIAPGDVFEFAIEDQWYGPYMRLANWDGDPLVSFLNEVVGTSEIGMVDLSDGRCYRMPSETRKYRKHNVVLVEEAI